MLVVLLVVSYLQHDEYLNRHGCLDKLLVLDYKQQINFAGLPDLLNAVREQRDRHRERERERYKRTHTQKFANWERNAHTNRRSDRQTDRRTRGLPLGTGKRVQRTN